MSSAGDFAHAIKQLDVWTTAADSENLRKYLSRNPIQRLLIYRFLDTVTKLAQQAKPRRILDVGCGEGFVLRALLQALPGASIHGCDINFRALLVNRALNPAIPLFVADARQLPLASQHYDLLVCCEVLEHIPYPRSALLSLKAVTQRFALISVPHEPFFSLANVARGHHLRFLGNHPYHVNRWARSSFVAFLEAEFCVLQLETPFPWLVALVERRGAVSYVSAPRFQPTKPTTANGTNGGRFGPTYNS